MIKTSSFDANRDDDSNVLAHISLSYEPALFLREIFSAMYYYYAGRKDTKFDTALAHRQAILLNGWIP